MTSAGYRKQIEDDVCPRHALILFYFQALN